MNAFENTKVRAPIFNDEVQASLTLASEKLVYFKTQGEQELEKKKEELLAGITKSKDEGEDKIMDDVTIQHIDF